MYKKTVIVRSKNGKEFEIRESKQPNDNNFLFREKGEKEWQEGNHWQGFCESYDVDLYALAE